MKYWITIDVEDYRYDWDGADAHTLGVIASAAQAAEGDQEYSVRLQVIDDYAEWLAATSATIDADGWTLVTGWVDVPEEGPGIMRAQVARKTDVTFRVTVRDSLQATVESLVTQAVREAQAAGLANVTHVTHGLPTTRDGYRSLWVTISTTTPAEYDSASDQIVLL